ncbi:CrcB family protein [Corynebacterium breve]|uniref:Fluoride-specific ion channel FluC n=1 Tax=Corynebacterium breve TaxID=3049799 RepID=A0ABY8VGE2_9CORY|nr:CrcB family protein [Corynebacterium breve]WIM67279.1 CrcB family protein [Corynebacterium breve]
MTAVLAVVTVVAGGFLGGLGRWALAKIPGEFVGTWTANMVACVILGVAITGPGIVPLALGTGCAGALSTWSTLAKQFGELVLARRWTMLATYFVATMAVGMVAAWRGTIWGARIWGYL